MSASTTTQEIETRIGAERERLASEERNEVALTESRLAPLEAGDDAELDKVERKIDESRSQQLRIQERIELLERRLESQRIAEHDQSLDELSKRTDQVRIAADKLIVEEYAKHAAALRAVLLRVLAARRFIDQSNRTLERAGRPLIDSIEEARTIAGFHGEEKFGRATVLATDPRHPRSKEYWELHRCLSHGAVTNERGSISDQMRSIRETEVEFALSREWIPAHRPKQLDETVRLPAVDPMADAFWDPTRLEKIETDASDIDLLLGEQPVKKRQRGGSDAAKGTGDVDQAHASVI